MASMAPVVTVVRLQWLDLEQEEHAKVQEEHDKAHHAEPGALKGYHGIIPKRLSWLALPFPLSNAWLHRLYATPNS